MTVAPPPPLPPAIARPIESIDAGPGTAHGVGTTGRALPRPRSWPLTGLTLAIAYLAIRIGGPQGTTGAVLGLAAFIPLSSGTALAFASAARRATTPSARRAFRGYAASFGCTALGTLLAVLGRLIGPKDLFDAWANLPYLLSYAFAIAAIVALPFWKPIGAGRLRLGLEAATAIVAGVALTWHLVVRQLPVPSDAASQFFLYAYPVSDLLVFATLAPLLLTVARRRDARILQLVATAQFAYILGDLAFLLLMGGANSMISIIADLLYVVGYAGLLWGAQAAAAHPELVIPEVEAGAREALPGNPLPLALGLLMYALLLAAAWPGGSLTVRVLALASVAVSLLVLAHDAISEQRNVELARELEVTRSAARMQGVVGNLRTGVAVLDRRGRLIVANAAARRWLEDTGAPGAEPTAIADTGEASEGPSVLARRAAIDARPIRGALLGVAEPGGAGRTWVLLDAEPLAGPDGRSEEIVCTLTDVTERRRVDERLQQAQRLEAVGQLAGGVAHDFNNLLTAITGYGSLLRRRLPAGSPSHEEVNEIMHAADRAATLTQQLLAYGRRQRLHPAAVDLNAVVREAARLLQQLVGASVVFRLDLADGLPAALVDRGMVEQVLVNLTVNARDAMPAGGEFTIDTRPVDRDAPGLPPGRDVPEGGGVLLRVVDTGSGMSEEVRARAFDPFFTTKPVGKGTGLGLSTVYGIVTQSGGDAWIASTPGRGTTVSVLLPASRTSPPA